ncbi:Transferase [Macleaya cordata]|uniref:Transferase n=1 Tax=Macleaya cordata TaxID=56857 RepID=A0A200PU70_MACCD|nr:Transferase [Macleaya cordata]
MEQPQLVFPVHVSEPELIRPETPTPQELKYLSNIDDQAGLRNHIPFVHFYGPKNDIGVGADPVPIIKQALSKALVHYYPIAGRLRKAEEKGKLVVDCCNEGVIFREADANVTLETLRKVHGGLRPSFPQWDRFLVDDVWGSYFITNSPLLRMQVTRLACGGFVFAYTFNHCVCDAYGAFQFVTTVSEFCQDPDRKNPSVTPSWGREILKPRTPPHVSYPHHEYDLDHTTAQSQKISTQTDFKNLAQTSVFISKTEILALKNQINGQKSPTFDAIASSLWRARTRTLLKPESVTKLLFPIDTRFRYKPSLPKGYYGSAVVFPCAVAKASELIEKPLHYAAGLVSEVKNGVTGDEYRASVLDFIEMNGRRGFCSEGAFVVSDMSRLGFADVDFGWGQGVYGGPSRAGTGLVPGMVTSVISHKNEAGVEGVLALVSLPSHAVERFHKEVRKEITGFTPVVALSAL